MGLFSRRTYDDEAVGDPNVAHNSHGNNQGFTGQQEIHNNYDNNQGAGINPTHDNHMHSGNYDNNNNNYNNNYNNNNNFDATGHGRTTTDNSFNNHGHDNRHDNRQREGRKGGFFSGGRGGGGHHENHREKKREKRAKKERRAYDIDSGLYNTRPSFGQWLKFTWLDILTMAAMGMVGLGIYEAHPAPSRSFPVTFADGEVVYPQFSYPLRNEIVPIWLAALLASLIPIFIILVMQIRIRSFWDVNNAVIGLLYSLISAAVFQVFLKWLIGGLRPHFLDVCDPDPALLTAGGKGFSNIMFDRKVCRGDIDQIDDSLESFPSGHSTAAWAGFLFLYFYLNAKLKVFSNRHAPMWTMLALYAPLLGATLITGALTIDEFHNWYDCVAGGIIGSVMAISAYRMVYASVWDFRFNHIPLTRHTPFSYGAGPAGAGGFESTVFTRAAGWGYEEALGGAPFDAAHGLRGQQAGFNTNAQGRHHGGGMTGNRREEDVEHNAATTGYNNNGPVTNDTGHHHDRHNRQDRHDHHEYDNSGTSHGGILSNILPGHSNRHDNVNNDGTYVNDAPNRNSQYNGEQQTGRTSENRYSHTSRSLERKRLPAMTGNSAETRQSGDY